MSPLKEIEKHERLQGKKITPENTPKSVFNALARGLIAEGLVYYDEDRRPFIDAFTIATIFDNQYQLMAVLDARWRGAEKGGGGLGKKGFKELVKVLNELSQK